MMPGTADQALQGAAVGSLVIDTNILVLLVVAAVDPARLRDHRRTRSLAVTPAELRVLQDIVQRFRSIRITPAILAETSNLLGNSSTDRTMLARMLEGWIEIHHPSQEIIATYPGEYLRMGLIDAAIIHVAAQSDVVLTDDAVLHNYLYSRGLFALNLAHLRSL